MTTNFAHLHLHSQYSLLDGAIRLADLFPRLQQYGMHSVALTDHGNMFGALDFYKQARAFRKEQDYQIKPIFGCETYIASDMHDHSRPERFHLILLARNMEGYKNLAYLVSKAYLDGFYYKPRIDKKLLRERRAGLIGLSACLSGEVPKTLLTRGIKRAEEAARDYAEIFEPDSFFLELQHNRLPEQDEVNEGLQKLARKTGIGLVATNDCHYLDRGDARAHDILMCVQTGHNVNDANRLRHDVDEFYLKSPQEMEQAFAHVPQALENAAAIAERCNVEIDLKQTFLPLFQVPEGFDRETYMAKLSRDGLKVRLQEEQIPQEQWPEYEQRLERELGVINEMKFPGYFLIVWDFINFAKQQGVPVGPGRGSGAGSLVAYALRITDLNPLPYGLLFERFLNPERVSMPDFDIDFCMNRRDEVIKYVTDKYGVQNVGQIATMHSLKARGVVRDVARAMGLSYGDGDKVAKLIPEPIQGKTVSINKALEQEPRLRELSEADPKVADLLQVASSLEGLNRHAGMHAAGVVIAEEPIWDYCPCFRGKDGELVTQFAKNEVEDIGLVKFDFLGLKTLTVLATAERLIRKVDPAFKVDEIPLKDGPTFEMIQAGQTTGVFQLESSGFKELLKKLRPDCFEDIIAAVALYRPGPLEGGMVDDFIKRKHGEVKVSYPHQWLEPILKETYGVIVYQEQVMQIAQVLAGFSLGGADLLRRAMGKKIEAKMAAMRVKFQQGAEDKGVNAKQAEGIFDLMAKFASYGFNKSHSACYALITLQTAYLKRHWPEEFMAAVLTCDKDNSDNLTKYIAETRAMGIKVVRPDVNESDAEFSVVEHEGHKLIRFGLTAVRNVGEGAVEVMIEARQEQPFTGLYDYCERVDARRVNRRVVEALVKSGAFDGVAQPRELTRARLMAALDAAYERAQRNQRDRESGQTSLFDMLGGGGDGGDGEDAVESDADKYPEVLDWEPRVRLSHEKDSLGFYVSGHPLDRYVDDLKRLGSTTVAGVFAIARNAAPTQGYGNQQTVSVGGLVDVFTERPLKSGIGRMASFNLEDKSGAMRVVCFSKAFAAYEDVLKADEPLLVTGRLKFEGEGDAAVPEMMMDEAVTLATLRLQKTTQMLLRLNSTRVGPEQIPLLKQALLQHVGECRTYLELIQPHHTTTQLVLSERYSVNPTDELLLKLERLFGERVAVLK